MACAKVNKKVSSADKMANSKKKPKSKPVKEKAIKKGVPPALRVRRTDPPSEGPGGY